MFVSVCVCECVYVVCAYFVVCVYFVVCAYFVVCVCERETETERVVPGCVCGLSSSVLIPYTAC